MVRNHFGTGNFCIPMSFGFSPPQIWQETLAPKELWLAFLSRTIKRRMPENGPKSPVNKCPTMSHLWDFNVFPSFPMSKSFPSCQAATSAAAHAPAPAGPGYWSGPPDRVRPRSLRNRPRVPGVILAIDGEQYLSWSMHANLPKEAQKVQYVSTSFNSIYTLLGFCFS